MKQDNTSLLKQVKQQTHESISDQKVHSRAFLSKLILNLLCPTRKKKHTTKQTNVSSSMLWEKSMLRGKHRHEEK